MNAYSQKVKAQGHGVENFVTRLQNRVEREIKEVDSCQKVRHIALFI